MGLIQAGKLNGLVFGVVGRKWAEENQGFADLLIGVAVVGLVLGFADDLPYTLTHLFPPHPPTHPLALFPYPPLPLPLPFPFVISVQLNMSDFVGSTTCSMAQSTVTQFGCTPF